MVEKRIQSELKFLITLKELSTQSLIDARLRSANFPEGFDLAKGLEVLKRSIDAEIEFLQNHPKEYLEIYG